VYVKPLAVSITPLDIMQMHGYGRGVLPFFKPGNKLELGREGVGIVKFAPSSVWNYKVRFVSMLSNSCTIFLLVDMDSSVSDTSIFLFMLLILKFVCTDRRYCMD
jgi:hypothetical protein